MAGALTTIRWSQPIKLFDATGTKQSLSVVPETPGVYRIRVLMDGQPVLLRRLCGDDPDGILDIGETGKGPTGTLQYRIGTFQDAVLRGTAPHAAGCKFHDYSYHSRFASDRLWADWIISADKVAARNLEKSLLADYRRALLDAPPLNASA